MSITTLICMLVILTSVWKIGVLGLLHSSNSQSFQGLCPWTPTALATRYARGCSFLSQGQPQLQNSFRRPCHVCKRIMIFIKMAQKNNEKTSFELYTRLLDKLKLITVNGNIVGASTCFDVLRLLRYKRISNI